MRLLEKGEPELAVRAKELAGREHWAGRLTLDRSKHHPHLENTPGHDDLDRWGQTTVSQIRSGCSPLVRATLFRIGLATSSLCGQCSEEDTVVHLLCDARKKKGEPADASEQAHLSESCVENDQSLCSVDLAGDFTYRLVGVVQLNGGAKHSGYYLYLMKVALLPESHMTRTRHVLFSPDASTLAVCMSTTRSGSVAVRLAAVTVAD
ncbi:hypothetical protein FJT64_018020 [Amphibalanus amphitrite]|uniref:Uncharacterized protein n=1 Tax=Amphibalanus amphitrite TaxID=1232801 RepID=A0A6A4X552_AMPAM|nr:hypothetical protein FJT64_018020 [Amphibalanus amphitrite]